METGTVKWFRDDLGYGFINPDNGGPEVFVHYSGIAEGEGRKNLPDGAKVEFDRVERDRGPGAVDVKVVAAEE
jgi:CspA family cold shock protein